jgi:hypothetical protein
MRSLEPGAGPASSWPEALAIEAPLGEREIAAAAASRQSLVLMAPVRLGVDAPTDASVLTFLSEAASWMVPVDWTLVGVPPWPLRTTVHLPPPVRGADPEAERHISAWRERHRFGLCTYRRGPGFARLLDIRPDGPHQRVLIDGAWTAAFDALLAAPRSPVEDSAARLLDELTEAGLALRLDDHHHVLPIRRRRAPIPSAVE